MTPNSTRSLLIRLPLLATVAVALLAGLLAGLGRLGLVLPGLSSGTLINHGPLMIGGVLGTLICLERAVALSIGGKRYALAYVAPLLSGVGGVLLALGSPGLLPKLLIALGSVGLVIIFALLVKRHPVSFIVIMAIGAACWLAGNLMWLAGQPLYVVVHWWIAFLIFTVVGERLELSRITRLTPMSQRFFLAAVSIALGGLLFTLADMDTGVRLIGVGHLALALWLLQNDIARRTIRRGGLPQFIAACLLTGYVWLGAGGVFSIVFGAARFGVQYEAILHALLLGFIFSMIFGHALIILPAITGRMVAFHRRLFVPLAVLHVSLVLRLIGALAGDFGLRQWGGTFNVIAVLLFFGLMAASTIASVLASKSVSKSAPGSVSSSRSETVPQRAQP